MTGTVYILSLIVIILLNSKSVTPLTCESGWHLFDSNCFFLSSANDVTTYSTASTTCDGYGGHLARPTTQTTDDFLHSILGAPPDSTNVWIDLTYKDDTWTWSDDSELALTYHPWVTSFPYASPGSNTCAAKAYSDPDIMFYIFDTTNDKGKWLGLDCETSQRFFCQKPAVGGATTNSPTSSPEITQTVQPSTTSTSDTVGQTTASHAPSFTNDFTTAPEVSAPEVTPAPTPSASNAPITTAGASMSPNDPIDDVIDNAGHVERHTAVLALSRVSEIANSGDALTDDLSKIIYSLSYLTDMFSENESDVEAFLQATSDILGLENKEILKTLFESHPEMASVFLSGVEEFVDSARETMLTSSSKYSSEKTNIALFAETVPKNSEEGTVVSSNSGRTRVTLPDGVLSDAVDVVVVEYNTMTEILNLTSMEGHEFTSYGSEVVSINVNYHGDGAKVEFDDSDPIIFRLGTSAKPGENEEATCSFWKYPEGRESVSGWSTQGCWKVDNSCQCNHLTNFAMLMRLTDKELSAKDAAAMTYLTSAGVGLSIVSLVAALFTFTTLHLYRSQRVIIHMNFATALLFAQTLFLLSGLVEDVPGLCKCMSILLHYFFLATFSWMLVEGINLYIKSTAAFNTGVKTPIYAAIGWGIPSLIVAVSLAVRYDIYGNGRSDAKCWLSAAHGLIWAFVGPVILVMLVNIVIFSMVIRAFMTLKLNADKSTVEKTRSGIRAGLVLLPLLGLTWLIGIVQQLQYLFIILNSLQGVFFFILHCAMNDEVKKAYQIKRKQASSSVMSSTTKQENPSFFTKSSSFSKDQMKSAWK
ncbi:adhesion G protein-coupled receptor E3-like isoform X2 [Ptychodera flava]|uniref:adhesion G protein-coupled receptor E3-like isoform X2 n=1 Tax=Ptychodera flava TaxID=63121 RepID=UPI00396A1740